jgi:hypothetical protein
VPKRDKQAEQVGEMMKEGSHYFTEVVSAFSMAHWRQEIDSSGGLQKQTARQLEDQMATASPNFYSHAHAHAPSFSRFSKMYDDQ